MPEQQVMWTALPREAGATELVLDVFVSPRLGINATKDEYTISEFPEFEHWTQTLENRLTFSVEFADGSVSPAQVEAVTLDHHAWNHIFRATTFVRPWSFKDLSGLPIYSFPARFVTAYLRDLYRDVGRRYPTAPPKLGDLERMRKDLGGVTDVRVPDERKPPPFEQRDLPEPPPEPGPEPTSEGRGCLALLLGPLYWLLGPILRWIRIRLGLPPFWTWRDKGPPPDPTKPKTKIPRTIHPSPYRVAEPIPPANLPKLEALEQQMVVKPLPKMGAMTDALAARDPAMDFTRVMRFYERPESEPPPGGSPAPEIPKLDFHQALGALGDYPALLRALGLLVRLRVPRPVADPASTRVIPAWDGTRRASDVSPRTRCVLDGDRFSAEQRGGLDLEQGMLDLRGASDRLATDTPTFDVIQVDSDGAAIKAVLHAASLERAFQLSLEKILGIDLFPDEPTAALRSGGLAIVRPDRASQVHGRLLAAFGQSVPVPAVAPNEPGTLPEELFAEDLVRGYRIEVSEDGGGSWRSLCSRVGKYRLVDEAGQDVRVLPEIVDEGYVKASSATSNGGAADPLYLHEALARWTGWSLSVPRPGRTLEPGTQAKPRTPGEAYEQPELPSSDPTQTEFRFAASFAPKPGSLPRLRFGNAYRLRALCIDLSGEPLDTPRVSAPSSDEITYRRFEPAAPPALLALRRYEPGESLERIVVRSDHDRTSVAWDDQEMSGTPADATARRTRHLFPPKTSQEMVELHGKLDHAPFRAFGGGAQPDAGYRLALREQGTFRDEKVIDVHTVDVDNPVATIDFGAPEDVPPLDPNDPGTYVINREDTTLPMPYLPDPAVAGIALRGVPGLGDHVTGDQLIVRHVDKGDASGETEPLLQIPFDGAWPDLRPVRLRVAEPASGPSAPNWDESERVLTVFLPKAGRAEIRYSSYVGSGELDRHGIWDWLDDGDPMAKLREQAQVGAHWMISPPRRLALVHAVQHPLRTAHFTALAPNRQLGETTAELVGKLKLDAASTGRIDVIGHWEEWSDPVDGKDFNEREAVACDFAVEPEWGDTPDFPLPPPKPGDSVRARQEFGDTKHRWVKYRVRATTSFREYFAETDPAKLSRDSEPSEVVKVSVKSSARPEPPRVLYAVPMFEWGAGTPASNWSTHTIKRGGGGLRVYLDRPWYSSGQGELLAVVLQAHEPGTLPEDQRSRYGADAIWHGAVGHAVTELLPGHFPNRADEETGVTLAGHDGLTATVVGFKPEWHGARELWFCDIQIDVAAFPWNYWPFVRFAFARYQRESLDDAKLSPIAIGEFAQVAPERLLSLVWQGTQKLDATLSGRAPIAPRPPGAAFRVQVAAAGAASTADELDWEHASGHSPNIDWQNFHTLVSPSDPDADGDVAWTHTVDLPVPRTSKRMRLEVAEYEFFQTDSEFGRGIPRMTYAAHVPLD